MICLVKCDGLRVNRTRQGKLTKTRQYTSGMVGQAIVSPHRVEQDRIDLSLVHYLYRVDEFDGRVLRVVLNENVKPPRIITVFFDRSLRGLI